MENALIFSIKFPQFFKEMYGDLENVWRICMWILGLKVLMYST